jgi:hypothetical protein
MRFVRFVAAVFALGNIPAFAQESPEQKDEVREKAAIAKFCAGSVPGIRDALLELMDFNQALGIFRNALRSMPPGLFASQKQVLEDRAQLDKLRGELEEIKSQQTTLVEKGAAGWEGKVKELSVPRQKLEQAIAALEPRIPAGMSPLEAWVSGRHEVLKDPEGANKGPGTFKMLNHNTRVGMVFYTTRLGATYGDRKRVLWGTGVGQVSVDLARPDVFFLAADDTGQERMEPFSKVVRMSLSPLCDYVSADFFDWSSIDQVPSGAKAGSGGASLSPP